MPCDNKGDLARQWNLDKPCRGEKSTHAEMKKQGKDYQFQSRTCVLQQSLRIESQADDRSRGTREQPADNDTPPDWGGETDEDDALTSWPWGESGCPSDRGQSEGILAERPSEPSGLPRQPQADLSEEGRGIQLIPNRMWQNVRTVQAHMEQARRQRRPPQ